MTVEQLVSLYDERRAMTKALAEHERPTGAMAQAVMAKGDELDAACEAYRRKHYPRRHRLFVAGRQVWRVSRTGRVAELIFDGGR